jgi:integrase
MAILAECPVCHTKQATKNKKCIGWLNKKSGLKCKGNLDDSKKAKTIRYWIVYRRKDGKQRWEAVGAFKGLKAWSITDAQNAHAKRTVEKVEKPLFDILPESKQRFSELTEWYLDLEKVKTLAYYNVLKINLDSFSAVFGDYVVSSIRSADLENYQAKRKKEGYSDSYIDQEIGAAKTVINKAFDNDLISGDTLKAFKRVKKLLKKGSNARKRVFAYTEYYRLYDTLPSHTAPIVATAFWTGMRRGEILNLTWDKIDLKTRMIKLESTDTKEGLSKMVPISETLKNILVKLPRGLHNDYVFLFRGKPIKDIREGFRIGCGNAGIPYGRKVQNGVTFHDLRHTAKTNMRKAGVDKNVRAVIFGHSINGDMDFRYDHIDESDLLDAIDRTETYLQTVSQTVSQENKNAIQKTRLSL